MFLITLIVGREDAVLPLQNIPVELFSRFVTIFSLDQNKAVRKCPPREHLFSMMLLFGKITLQQHAD